MSDRISLDRPAPTYGVAGYEVAAAKPTDLQDAVVLCNILTHDMAVLLRLADALDVPVYTIAR